MDIRDSLGAGAVEVFSFDLFDTFLLRRCSGPDGVFERTFALAPVPPKFRHLSEDFVRQREAAETAARDAAFLATGSAEVTAEEIYAQFPLALFGLSANDRAALVEAEFQAERELCFANPELVEPFNQLRKAGIRTGFVADGCWNAARLSELLGACAPGVEWDFLFTSCDLRAGKADTLFTRVLSALKASLGAAAHLGDNELADVVSARTLGMHAVRLPQSGATLAALFQREIELFDAVWAPLGASRRLDGGIRTVRRAIAARAPSGSAAFDYGMQVLGPVMAAFDRFIAGRVQALGRQHAPVAVVFAGEHGLLPSEIWRVMRDTPAVHLPNGDLAELRAALPTLDLCRHTIAVVEADGDGLALPSLRAAAQSAGLPHDWHGLHLVGGNDSLLPAEVFPVPLLDGMRAGMTALNRLCGATGDGRPFPEMHEMLRLGAAYFAREAAAMGDLSDTLTAAGATPWLAAVLVRALLRPSDDESALLAALDQAGVDEPYGTAEIALLSQEGQRRITVSRLRTGHGEIRLRVPVTRDGDAFAVAVPATALPQRGTVRAVTLQSGDSAVEAMRSRCVRTLPLAAVQSEDMPLEHGVYQSRTGTGRLVIELPPLDHPMGLVTVTVSPLALAS